MSADSEDIEVKRVNKQLVLPIGVSVVTVVAAFLGGAMWITAQIGELRAAINAQGNEMRADIADLKKTVAVIDASRFTATNGLEVWQAIADVFVLMRMRVDPTGEVGPLCLGIQISVAPSMVSSSSRYSVAVELVPVAVCWNTRLFSPITPV